MSSSELEEAQTPFDAAVRRELLRTIASLRYGTVEITIHNGRVVQLEKREKIRLPDPDSVRASVNRS